MADQTINVLVTDLETVYAEIQEVTYNLELTEFENIVVEVVEVEPIIMECVQETYIVDMAPQEIIVELVECVSITVPEEPVAGSGGGYVFITDVTADGIITNKVYTADTVPIDYVLEECLSDTDLVEVYFIAEGGSNYSPTVTVDGIPCINLIEVPGDKRFFSGSVIISVLTTKTVDIVSSTGQSTSLTINKSGAGPEVLTCTIGTLPGVQTAAKAGDVVHVTGTVEAEATEVRLLNYGISGLGNWEAVSAGSFDIAVTVSSRTGNHAARVEARNSIGTTGDGFISDNTILLDQTIPQFVDNGTTFPAGQEAFKELEEGSQDILVTDYSDLSYISPNGDFIITNETTYEQNKIITCTNPGTYNDSVINFNIVAVKASNDTIAEFNKIIEVADTAPIINISQPESRLRSSPIGTEHTITATSNQNLLIGPEVSIPVGGTWQGTEFSGSGKAWTRNLLIADSDAKGTGAWILTSATNRAGITATITGDQVNGGFFPRDIVLEAFQNEVLVNIEVTDYSKISIGFWEFTGATLLRSSTINDNPPVPGYFTINTIGISPHTFRNLDTNQTNASSQATVIYDYEESV